MRLSHGLNLTYKTYHSIFGSFPFVPPSLEEGAYYLHPPPPPPPLGRILLDDFLCYGMCYVTGGGGGGGGHNVLGGTNGKDPNFYISLLSI